MFTNPVAGFIPNSEFVYTTTTVNADDVNCTNLTAVNANITNLVTTTFSPVNINGTNLSVVTASIGTANIDTANINTAIIDVSYTTISNNDTILSNNAILNNLTTNEIKLNDKQAINPDDALIYRDANQVNFIGKTDPTGVGVDYLFYHDQKLGIPRFIIHRDSDLCEAQNMEITNRLTSKAIDTEVIEFIDNTLANRKSYVQLVNGQLKFIAGTGTNTNMLFYNKLTDGPILTIYNLGIQVAGTVDAITLLGDIYDNLQAGTGITLTRSSGKTIISSPQTDPLTINTLYCTTIYNKLYLFRDYNNNADISRIYREGNILKIAGGAVAGDESASIFLYTGPPTGTPQLQISKNTGQVKVIDFESDDIFSLRATITTFNSSNITSTFIGSDDIEAKILTFNDETTSNTSYFERVNDKFRFVGSDSATAVDWEFYKNDGINPLMKLQASNDRVIIDGTLLANISPSIKAGTGIVFSVDGITGVTTITNSAPLPDPLTINTLNCATINSTSINNSGTTTTNTINNKIIEIVDVNNSNVSTLTKTNNILNLFGTSTSTPIDINFFTKLYTSNSPILQLLGNENKVVINQLLDANTIECISIKGNISQNLIAGPGIELFTNTATGVTKITNTGLVVSPLTIDTINSTTINNSGLITTDNMTVTGILNAPNIEGFSTSTEYAFQATGPSSDQSIGVPTRVNFNTVQIIKPAGSTAYKTGNQKYVIQSSGTYVFGFKLFIQGQVSDFRVGIIKTGVGGTGGGTIAMGGRSADMTESVTVMAECLVGEEVFVQGIVGSGVVFTGATLSWFYGYKLTPANNIIDSTTDLTVKNLTTTNDLTVDQTIHANLIQVNTLVTFSTLSSTADIIANGTVSGSIGNFSDSLITSDLTVNTSITGATNINISGNIETTGIIDATTITGNISGNLAQSTGISLNTAAGITTITNTAPYQIPISRIYSRLQSVPETPSTTSLLYYTTFNTATSAVSPHVTFVAPNINTGGANTGFIIQTAGTYRISFTICVHSVSYTNRVNWRTRLSKNGSPQEVQTFIYTRSDDTQYGQYGSASSTAILTLSVGDYLQLVTLVAKNSSLFNNDFTGLQGYDGSQFIIELIS